jgi:aminopeptidase YwaD
MSNNQETITASNKIVEYIQEADLDYAFEFIRRICLGIGPGAPCTLQEHARADAVATEMNQVADKVRIEQFRCAPNAFIKWFKFACVLAVVATGFFYLGLLPISPLLFTAIGYGIEVFIFLILVFEFILSQEFIDFLYIKKQSGNVVGVIKPKGGQSTKRLLIFGGHHDTALQFNYLRYLKFGYYIAEGILIIGVIVLNMGILLRLVSIIFALNWDWVNTIVMWLSWTILPVSVFIGFSFTEQGKNGGSVPGALDNLSAVAITLCIGRVLKRHPELQPPNTEIRLISFGCEEAGVRGSRAYVRAHEEELKKLDTTFINFETIYDPEIVIFKGDRNGTILNSREVVSQLADAAQSAQVPYKVNDFPFAGGGTDATSFREKGIKAACLFGMKIPSQMMQFYHQVWDNFDQVNKAALKNALRIAVEYLRRFR